MIILNKVKFAENESELLDSLFSSDGTCSGYAERLKHKIKLFDLQKNLVGVINEHGVLCKARLLENGKYWYSLADISLLGEYDYTLQFDEIYNLHVKTDIDGKRHYKA